MSDSTGRASIEARLGRLEDLERIKALKARYALACDNNYDPDGIASLFVEDGVWEAETDGPAGRYASREAIREFFAQTSEQYVWALHFIVSPLIEIADDGRSATGRWYLLGLLTMQDAGAPPAPVLVSGIYEDEYVKRGEDWMVASMKIHMHQMSDWGVGWVDQRYRGR